MSRSKRSTAMGFSTCTACPAPATMCSPTCCCCCRCMTLCMCLLIVTNLGSRAPAMRLTGMGRRGMSGHMWLCMRKGEGTCWSVGGSNRHTRRTHAVMDGCWWLCMDAGGYVWMLVVMDGFWWLWLWMLIPSAWSFHSRETG